MPSVQRIVRLQLCARKNWVYLGIGNFLGGTGFQFLWIQARGIFIQVGKLRNPFAMSGKEKKTKKKTNIKKPFGKCVEMAKELAKIRDNYKCLHCGKSKEMGYQIHGSHIFGVGAHPRMATEIDNIKALCSTCHRWWHSSPTLSGRWFQEKYPDWWKKLNKARMERERSLSKPSYQQLYTQLKEALNKARKD